MISTSKSFYKRFFIFLAFAIPLAYLGIIVTVIIHEVLGHGVWSLMVGGDFTGFTVKPDGFGWANVDASHTSIIKQVIVLLAGPYSTLFFGILFLLISIWIKRRFFLSLGILILAFNCLLEGPSYSFWNTVNPLPPGDFGRVLELVPSQGLRFSIMAIGGMIMLGAIIFGNMLLYQKGNDWLSEGKGLQRTQKWIFITFLFIAQTTSWFILDWNQIAPGLNMTPNVVGTLITAFVLIILGCSKPGSIQKYDKDYYSSWKKTIISTWVLAILVVILLFGWLQHGITW